MKLFRSLLSKKAPDSSPNSLGRILIQGDILTFIHPKGHSNSADLSTIDRISASITKVQEIDAIRFLIFETGGKHTFVPPQCEGYDELISILKERFKITNSQIDPLLSKYPDARWVVWERHSPDTTLYTATDKIDLERQRLNLGFTIKDGEEIVIPWAETIDKISTYPFVRIVPGILHTRSIHFDKPVFLGSIAVKNFYINDCDLRKDVPPRSFICEIALNSEPELNFSQAIDQFSSLVGAPAKAGNGKAFEEIVWEWKYLTFSLQTRKSFLGILNRRTYTDFVSDYDYNLNAVSSIVISFSKNFQFATEFRNNPWLRETPESMQHGPFTNATPFIIWRDDMNRRFGFGNGVWCTAIPWDQLLEVRIYRRDPDQGGTSDTLQARVLKYDFWIDLAQGELEEFNAYHGKISDLLRKDLKLVVADR